jgi:hypothetical protein
MAKGSHAVPVALDPVRAGRRTCSAGECGMRPSMTQVRYNPATTENRRETVEGLNRADLLHPPDVELEVGPLGGQRV